MQLQGMLPEKAANGGVDCNASEGYLHFDSKGSATAVCTGLLARWR